MKGSSEIRTVMTPFPHTVGLDQPIRVARALLQEYQIRHLPVQEGGKLVGVISERDLNLAMGMGQELKVLDIYVPEPFMVPPTAKLFDVVSRMAADRLGCALVVEKGKLVGIYTAVDACRDFSAVLQGAL